MRRSGQEQNHAGLRAHFSVKAIESSRELRARVNGWNLPLKRPPRKQGGWRMDEAEGVAQVSRRDRSDYV